MEILIFSILVLNILIFLGYFTYTQYRKLKAYENFKPFQFTIGKVSEYNAEHEKFLIHNKEVLAVFQRYIDVNLAVIPDQMANPGIVNDELRRLQGKLQAYLEVRRGINTFINSEIQDTSK